MWDKNRALVHVSGHGSQEELKLLMAMAKPTYFMPVHGEAVHLRAHAQLARKMGIKDDHIFILDNGDTLEMRGGIVKRGTPVESGVVYVDGLRIGDTDPIVLRDRQKLANDGMSRPLPSSPSNTRRSRPSSSRAAASRLPSTTSSPRMPPRPL